MYNTCISSNLYLGTDGSFPFPCHDSSSYYCFNDRFDRVPSSLSTSSLCCCACCACCVNRVAPVVSSSVLLYGLRQSALLQFSASRRLMVGSGARCYSRALVLGTNWRDCEIRRLGGGNGLIKHVFSEGRSGWWDLDDRVSDAEVMFSLLTEDMDEEDFLFEERDKRVSRRVREEKRENVCEERSRRKKKKNISSGSLKSGALSQSETIRIGSKEVDNRWTKRRGDTLAHQNHRFERDGASSSMQYSVSYSDDAESDTEIEVENAMHVSESSNNYKKDLRSKKDRITGENHRRKKHVGSVLLESDAKHQFKSDRVKPKEVENRKIERREDILAGKKHNLTKEGSSGPSYCSVSLSNDRESDMEIHVKNRTHLGDSSGSYKELRGRNDKQKVKGEVVKEFEIHSEDKEGRGRVSRQEFTSVSSYGEALNSEWNRKKSEKRLAEVSTENSRQEYAAKHLFVSDAQADSKITSFPERQHKTTQEKLHSERHTNEETRQKHGRTSTLIVHDSASSTYKESESEKISSGHAESNSRYQKQFSGKVQHSSADFNHASEMRDEHIGLNLGRERTQKYDGRLKIQEVEGQSTVNLQMQPESKSKDGAPSVQSLIQGTREENLQKNQKDVLTYESHKGSKDVRSITIAHTIDTETITDNQQAYEKRTNTSGTKFPEETFDRRNQFGWRSMQIKSSNGDQKLAKLPSFQEDTSEKASHEQMHVYFTSDSRVQNIHSEEKVNISVQPVIMIPPVQPKARWSPDIKPTIGSTSEEAKGDILVSQNEQKDEGRRQERLQRPSNLISDADALGSAECLEKSSVHLVGEFVSKARPELSTSEIQEEKQKKKSAHEGEEMLQMGYDSEGITVNENESRRPSGFSETKAPSDEMWHVTETSAKEPPKTKTTQQPITTKNPVVMRTGRSLWNVIGDVVRLRWTSNPKSDSSAAKSGGRSSSNESVSSDAWFSGHEQDQNSDKHVASEQGNLLQESTSASWLQIEKAHVESQGEGSDIISLKDPIRHGETGSSSSADTAESGSASQDVYLSPLEEKRNKYAPISRSQGYSDSGFGAITSLPLVSEQPQRSPAVTEVSVTGKTEISGSDSSEQIHKSPRVTLSKVSVPEGKDGELKRRKLQRNKQVPKDMFEEWEDAYKHEREQRKMDEMFMAEALLEAKKAADTWEVPVGAVLVQHGKIIARGCNLVEELRDSTAHAEMICIREASKQLRSWRLEDATLYVTLEPCPMCAGAILQARIDTLVWGAPNKLLGADGSWIRLFPNGSEEGNVSESTDKPPHPVHPFHPKMTIRRGVLASECADAMQQFFQLRRRNKNTKAEKSESPTSPSCLPVTTHPTKLLTKMHGLFNTFC